MKAAKDAGEEYYDPERKDNIMERNKTRLELWEEPQRPDRDTGQSSEVCGESVLESFGPRIFWREQSPMASVGFLQSLWEEPIWEGVWPHLDPMDSVFLRTASTEWKVPGK